LGNLGDDTLLFLVQDGDTGKIHILEDKDTDTFPRYVCGVMGNTPWDKAWLVEPKDLAPSLNYDPKKDNADEPTARALGVPVYLPTVERIHRVMGEIEEHVCKNCLRRINGAKWKGKTLYDMLEILACKYAQDKLNVPPIKYGPPGVPKSQIMEASMDSTAIKAFFGSSCSTEGTSVLTVKIEVEFDLNEDCPSEVVESIDNLKYEAEKQGTLTKFNVVSDGPLNLDLS
jgi:hypothetical protein